MIIIFKLLPNASVRSQSIKEDMLFLSTDDCVSQYVKWQPRKPKQQCNNCKHAQPVHNNINVSLG